MSEDAPIKLEHDAPIKLKHDKPAKLTRQAPFKGAPPGEDAPVKLETGKKAAKTPNAAPALSPRAASKPSKKHQPVPAPAGGGTKATLDRALKDGAKFAAAAGKSGTKLAKDVASYARKRSREIVTPKAHDRRPHAHKVGAGKAKADRYVHAKRLRSARARLLDDGLWVGCLGTAFVLVLVLATWCRRRCRRKRRSASALPLHGGGATAASPLQRKPARGFAAPNEALPPAVVAACRANRVDVVEDWLRGCKSPDARAAEPPRRAATHVAATHGAAAACRALLHAGADPNVADDAGDLPLHLAAAFGSGAVVKILLDHGADPAAADALGQDAKARAVAKGNTGCALLVSKRLTAENRAARGAAHRRPLKMEP